jgi:hypothetical protein
MNDHDLLTRMDVKLDTLCKGFSNHLRHHWSITIVLLTAVLGLIGTLIIALL